MTNAGLDVICAQSGAGALNLLETARPDLILLDVDMPDMNGLELCSEIRGMPAFKDVPILFQSVLSDSNIRVEGLKAGAADFLSKPYQPDEILLRVGIHLKIHALQTKLEEAVKERTRQLTAEIHERKQVEKDLIKSKQELRSLALHLQDVREAERKRIAREIHDELGQTLSLAQIELKTLSKSLDPEDGTATEVLERASGAVAKSAEIARSISENLRPGMLDVLGLKPALEHHIDNFSKATGLECEFSVSLNEALVLDDKYATAVFRIVQESLTNIAKHARASRVDVQLMGNTEGILVIIKDNGIGLPAAFRVGNKPSFGLVGIRERVAVFGGDLIIEGKPGTGTKVEAFLPLEADPDDH